MQEVPYKNIPFIIAEIGINHNGSMELAKKLIDGAKMANCDAVKFQKQNLTNIGNLPGEPLIVSKKKDWNFP
jgi:N-acetylneuraminate synthase